MPGFFFHTEAAPARRSVSTEVPGTPLASTILPLPCSALASHSAVNLPAANWLMWTLYAHGAVTSPS